MATSAIPEQGQLVEVRRRRYIVGDVARSTLAPSLLFADGGEPQHLVTLTSVEDDALGEELQVIWELEPGATVHERTALPDLVGFDSPRRLDAFLNAVRWGAVSSADVHSLQAPFRSGIEIQPYQLDPVARAIQMPRVNLLVADDVGLGKTIEAGLVIQELIIRHRARRILVVCPSALQIQWRDQMRDKFGLEFRIVDSALMKELRRSRGIHANPWSHFPRLITSMDFLKRERPLRLLREILPAEGEVLYPRRFDLMVVDEAHHVAPSAQGRYAIDSQRTAAIRLLAPHFEHKLFLSATPHNGYAESFSVLLELLDNQRFARGIRPDPELLGAVMVRRLKSELKNPLDGSPLFPGRQLRVIEVDYTDEEREAHRWLQAYTEQRQRGQVSASEKTAMDFVLKLLKKRLFSSPSAFAHTLEQHRKTLAEMRSAKGPTASVKKPAPGILRAMIESVEEDQVDDETQEEATSSVVWTMSRLFAETGAAEQELLDRLQQWGVRASSRPDTKALALIDWLGQHIRPNGTWSDERVVIFTEYRTTQNWLQGMLAARGFTAGDRLMTLSGGMLDDDRERVKAAFQASPHLSPVRILLATDAASEGIDLQLHCRHLIHYEIPWNPNRLEQRNGRIDRHGQRHSPQIFHFAPRGFESQVGRTDINVGALEGDLEFLMRAVQKVEQIREDIGKVGPVIADQVADAMLGRRKQLDTNAVERDPNPARKLLKFERDLAARIQKLDEQLQQSRHTLQLTPQNIYEVVRVALALAGQPALQEAQLEGVWPDPSGKRQRSPVFHLPQLTGSWARYGEGLEHPHTKAIRPIVFDDSLARRRDDVVLVHLNHQLVQMALRLLRAEVWSTGAGKRLNRVTARLVPNHILQEPAVVALGRLVVTGGDSHRLHEELISAGGTIHERRFRRMNVGQVQQALESVLDDEPSGELKGRLKALWEDVRPSLVQALEARRQDRVGGLESLLNGRAEKEASDIAAVLRELERSIRVELDEPQYQQLELELFSTSERDQYHRNVQALQARLAQIPAEIEREVETIRARYADPTPRLFPVAVMFLIPERMA